MQIIGAVFAVIVVLILLFFGLGIVSSMMEDAEASVDDGSALNDSLTTATEMTAPAFSIMTAGVWLMVLVFVIGGLYLLMNVL